MHFLDIQSILGHLLHVWFFATPVSYAYGDLGPRMKTVLRFNPMTTWSSYQQTLFEGRFYYWRGLGASAVVAVLTFAVGAWLLRPAPRHARRRRCDRRSPSKPAIARRSNQAAAAGFRIARHSIGHEVPPDERWQLAARHFVHRRFVVVADPSANDERLVEADEPGIAIILARAGLPGRKAVERRGPARSSIDNQFQQTDERLLVWLQLAFWRHGGPSLNMRVSSSVPNAVVPQASTGATPARTDA